MGFVTVCFINGGCGIIYLVGFVGVLGVILSIWRLDMRDGKFTFYTIQHKRIAESPWLKPMEPLLPCEGKEWVFSSFDYFGASFDLHAGTGNDWNSIDKVASNELHDVWSKTSDHGWWSLKYAIAALKQVRKDDAKGKYDTRDSYGRHEAAVRHRFRIVKQTVSQKTEVVRMHKDVLKMV